MCSLFRGLRVKGSVVNVNQPRTALAGTATAASHRAMYAPPPTTQLSMKKSPQQRWLQQYMHGSASKRSVGRAGRVYRIARR